MKYINEQLDSILHQTYSYIDILVRDDGSTDATLNVLSEYQQRYNTIKVIAGNNVGCAQSFWQLLQEARDRKEHYTYFAFSDQDDFWQKEKMEVAIRHLNKMTTTGKPCLYCSNLTVTDSNLKPIGHMRSYIPDVNDKAKSLVESFATGCTMVFNKELLVQATSYSFQNIIMHDLWIFHTCMFLGNIYYDQTPYILYRQHIKNEIGAKLTFTQKMRSKLKSIKTIGNQHFREVEAQNLLKAYKAILTPHDKKLIEIVATYRQHLRYRLGWFIGLSSSTKGLRMTHPVDNFFLKIRILIGRV